MWLTSVLAVGCYSESTFVPEKTDAFCAWLLRCEDPAVIAFDGMDLPVCQGTFGPTFQEEGADCRKFKRGIAKQCVASLEAATCPPEGTSVEEAIPEVCAFVYERCDAFIPAPAPALPSAEPADDTTP
jgi:hypothetical protein